MKKVDLFSLIILIISILYFNTSTIIFGNIYGNVEFIDIKDKYIYWCILPPLFGVLFALFYEIKKKFNL